MTSAYLWPLSTPTGYRSPARAPAPRQRCRQPQPLQDRCRSQTLSHVQLVCQISSSTPSPLCFLRNGSSVKELLFYLIGRSGHDLTWLCDFPRFLLRLNDQSEIEALCNNRFDSPITLNMSQLTTGPIQPTSVQVSSTMVGHFPTSVVPSSAQIIYLRVQNFTPTVLLV